MVKKQKNIIKQEIVDVHGNSVLVLMSNPIMIYENTKGFYVNTPQGRTYITKMEDGSFYLKITRTQKFVDYGG